ncbi:MAG: hypothetical protein U9Q34_03775 [Elusimicrobiota bacterium]|nr:hypothetical protein [Elusimicrobiota bacterium]
MKFKKILLPLAFMLLTGCASFQSGDILSSRTTIRKMLNDKNIQPFAKIEVSWKNFPYKSASDSIGIGSITNPPKPQAYPVRRKDSNYLQRKAKDVFSDAGLYDSEKGKGTLTLEMVSFGKWTYGDLFRSFLVDTGWIMILPASLRVNYLMQADFEINGQPAIVKETATHKTTFHALIFPLYPLFSPGMKEKSMIRNMLWKCATDIYTHQSSSLKKEDRNLYDDLLKLQVALEYFPKHLKNHSFLFDSSKEPLISVNKAKKQLLALIINFRNKEKGPPKKTLNLDAKDLNITLKSVSSFMNDLMQNGYSEDNNWQDCRGEYEPVSLEDFSKRFVCYHCEKDSSSSICP